MEVATTITGILWNQVISKFKNFPGTIHVGDYTYGNPNILSFSEDDKLIIGKFCSIANNVTIVLSEHSLNLVSTFPLKSRLALNGKEVDQVSKGPIIIGNDVLIGTGSIILSGVKIGDGAVIGAGSVVTNDVPPYAIVVGDPAEILRYRFNLIQVEKLLKIAWWNWDIEKIKSNLPYFYEDVDVFISKFEHS